MTPAQVGRAGRSVRVRGRSAHELSLVAALGVALAVMVLSLYEAIERMPLGVAITVELLGSLSVATPEELAADGLAA